MAVKKKKAGKRGSKSPGVDGTLARPGGLSYLEIPAANVRKSAVFYGKVLGWKVEERDGGDFRFSDRTGHLIGRLVQDRAVLREVGWLPYFYVERIKSVVGRVKTNGGKIVKKIYPEGNLRVAVVRDPAGNMLGLWEMAGR